MTMNYVELEIDFAVPQGRIRPLNGVNCGPLMGNGSYDDSTIFREFAFAHSRLHDCTFLVLSY